MARCSRAEYSTGQVAAYARRWLDKETVGSGDAIGCTEAVGNSREMVVAEIVGRLVREKFVDDRRFAAAFVRDKLKFNGWGKQKIVYKMRSLGVDNAIISEAIAENYYSVEDGRDASQVVEKLVRDKWEALCRRDARKMAMEARKMGRDANNMGRGTGDCSEMQLKQARKAAVLRFAMGRGFDYEEILKCLNNIV